MGEREADLCCGHATCQRLVREAKAEAWDEGHRFTGYEPARGENPYRSSDG